MRNLFVAVIILAGSVFALIGGPFYALLFYLWYAYFRPEQWLWTDWVSSLSLSSGIGIFLIVSFLLWGRRPRFGLHFVLPACFVLVCLLSYQQSAYKEQTWPLMLEFLKVSAISYFIAVLADDIRKIRLVFITIGLSLGLEAVKQGWVNVIRNPGAQNTNPVPFLGDNNGVGLGMLMLAAIIVALVQTSKTSFDRRGWQFAAIGVSYRALTTYSRGAFVSAGALVVFYLLCSRHRLKTAVGIGVLSLMVLPVLPPQFWARMDTIGASAGERDESVNSRLHFWQVALRMASDSPVVGIGFSAYKFAYGRYDTVAGELGEERAPHSAWFGALAEVGATGLTLYILMLLQTLWLCQRAVAFSRDLPQEVEFRSYARALQGCVVVVIVGGTFLHVQYSEMLWHVFALSIALNIVAREQLPKKSPVLAGYVASPVLRSRPA